MTAEAHGSRIAQFGDESELFGASSVVRVRRSHLATRRHQSAIVERAPVALGDTHEPGYWLT